MSKVDELKTEIERLPREEFTELVRWLSEKDWVGWDKEIEADSEAGKPREPSRICETPDNGLTSHARRIEGTFGL